MPQSQYRWMLGATACALALSQTLVFADDAENPPEIADPAATASLDGQRPAEAPLASVDAQRLYDARIEALAYAEAVDAGKLVVTGLIAEGVSSGPKFATALDQLADAQFGAGEFQAAAENFAAAIVQYEGAFDRLAEPLFEPLRGKARAEAALGDYWSAADTYERALHTHNVNAGLMGLDQRELLQEMSENYFQVGDFQQANSLQRFLLDVTRRNYPGNDVRTLPAFYSRAAMLSRTGDHIKAQEMYRRAIQIVERAEGRYSMTLVPALSKLADSYLYNEIIDGQVGPVQAQRRLRRIISIVKRSEEATPLQLADAYIAMGDFEYLRSDHLAGAQSYRQAWDILADDPALENELAARFSKPVALNGLQVIQELEMQENRRKRLKRADSVSDEEMIDGVVTVVYDVSPRGEAKNLQIVESTPPGINDDKVLRTLREFIFRPKVVDRKPVRATEIRYSSTFRYRPEEVEAMNVVVAGQPTR